MINAELALLEPPAEDWLEQLVGARLHHHKLKRRKPWADGA
jgi:hypothetical protein